MPKTLFKIHDEATDKYWNGNTSWPAWNNKGQKWSRRESLERDLTWYLTNLRKDNPSAKLPGTWRIVEFECIEQVRKSNPLDDFMFAITLKSELTKIGWRHLAFYNKMEERGVANDIEFIIKLKANDNERFISSEKILQARAQLRLIGIKTRTFREFYGMFGMLNRQQAMRARLVLDIESSIDLGELRQKTRDALDQSGLSCLPPLSSDRHILSSLLG